MKKDCFKNFYDKLLKKEELFSAWRSVYSAAKQSNSTRSQEEVETFKNNEQKNINKLFQHLSERNFIPVGRATPIEKEKNKHRPIVSFEIPTRIVQKRIFQILIKHANVKDILAKAPFSFGGIKDKGVRNAIEEVYRTYRLDGYNFYIATDIKSFFTKIKSENVLSCIRKFCHDEEFMKILTGIIHIEVNNIQEIQKNYPNEYDLYSKYDYFSEGVPQGCCLSPLFGNLYLSELDIMMNQIKDIKFIRYVDDVIILGKTETEVEDAFANVFLPKIKELNLSAYTKGSDKFQHGAFTQKELSYLGVTIYSDKILPDSTKVKNFEKNINQILVESLNFKAKKIKPLQEAMNDVSNKIKGWTNHYSFCNANREKIGLDNKIDAMINKFIKKYIEQLNSLKKPRDIRKMLGITVASEIRFKEESIYDKVKKEQDRATN